MSDQGKLGQANVFLRMAREELLSGTHNGLLDPKPLFVPTEVGGDQGQNGLVPDQMISLWKER